MLNILADENIPLLNEAFGHAGQIVSLPGRQISREACQKADILLVRSVTKVNAALLEGTPVRFVGSATTGVDHLDTLWLDQAGIAWASAPGCNATAVVEYLICSIAALQLMGFLKKAHPRAAIIGLGRIGEPVCRFLQSIGFETLACDPLRPDLANISLEAIAGMDLVTLHTPLTREGAHPTFHMIDRHFLQRQPPHCILLNTGRGAAIRTEDLNLFGHHLAWCLDVFENEPFPDVSVLSRAILATPHIAGYSIQAKWRGTQRIYEAAVAKHMIPRAETGFPAYPRLTLTGRSSDWRQEVLRVFDPRACSEEMKSAMQQPQGSFDRLRKDFPARHEFAFTDLSGPPPGTLSQRIFEETGFSFSQEEESPPFI